MNGVTVACICIPKDFYTRRGDSNVYHETPLNLQLLESHENVDVQIFETAVSDNEYHKQFGISVMGLLTVSKAYASAQLKTGKVECPVDVGKSSIWVFHIFPRN
eukprot:scaffold7344_cov122-Amphora_coffeaeformis.AAC.3